MGDAPFDPTWIDAYAEQLGVEPLDAAQRDALLGVAGRAAHGSGDRRNAPLACLLVGLALGRDGRPPSPGTLEQH